MSDSMWGWEIMIPICIGMLVIALLIAFGVFGYLEILVLRHWFPALACGVPA